MKDALSSFRFDRRDLFRYAGATAFSLLFSPDSSGIRTPWCDQPVEKQTEVNPVWEVPLHKEGPISYAEAMAVAKRIDSCIVQLPIYQLPVDITVDAVDNPDMEEKVIGFLDLLYKDVAPSMETNGFTGPVLPPRSVKIDNSMDWFHGATSDPKSCRNIRFNLQRLQNAPEQTRLSRFIKQAIHTFSHVGQQLICGDKAAEPLLEATAQIMTAEVLAYMVLHNRPWAFEPLLVHLKEMALLTAWKQAAEENSEELFQSDLGGITDAYSDVLDLDLKTACRYEQLAAENKELVDKHGIIPFDIIVRSTQEKKDVLIIGLSLPGIYHEEQTENGWRDWRTPRSVILDDIKSLAPNIDDLARYFADKGYGYQKLTKSNI